MTDGEVNVKLAVIAASIVGIIAVGFLMLYVIIPVFLLASVIDFVMRQGYNTKLAAVQSQGDVSEGPEIHSFDARVVDGEVMIGWLVDIPGDGQLDIFRVSDHGGGSIDDLAARGVCIHSTAHDFTNTRDELFLDAGVPDGTYFYVPVVSGLLVEKEPLPYSFLDFASEVQYRTRRKRIRARGEAVLVEVAPQVVEQLPDLRDAPSRIADDVMSAIRSRRKFDADLDAAISRIESDSDLSEDEKQEAVELLETRAATI